MKNNLLTQIGSQIKTARKTAGLSQNDLAEKTGTTASVISEIENGKRNISLLILAKIVRALGLKLIIKMRKVK